MCHWLYRNDNKGIEVLENINFLLFVTATLYVQKGTSETFKVWELYEKFNKVVFFGYYGL